MNLFSRFHSKDQLAAFFFALLSQSIWLPVIFAGSHDQHALTASTDINSHARTSNQRSVITSSLHGRAISSADISTRKVGKGEDTGIVLRSTLTHPTANRFEHTHSQSDGPLSKSLISYGRANPSTYPLLSNPVVTKSNNSSSLHRVQFPLSGPGTFVNKLYSNSELLGGVLTIQNINEPLMPAVARAERAQWMRSGDPLAPLPEPWREPMRRALTSLINPGTVNSENRSSRVEKVLDLDYARFVHVPSTKVRRSSEVPLALQADGSVDILNQPDDPAILEEINRWSTRQQLPAKGKVRPAVVHLHPLMNEPEEKISRNGKSFSQIVQSEQKLPTNKPLKTLVKVQQAPTLYPSAMETRQASPIPAASETPSTSESSAVSPSSPAPDLEPLGLNPLPPANESES
jgi:hypothetical protein